MEVSKSKVREIIERTRLRKAAGLIPPLYPVRSIPQTKTDTKKELNILPCIYRGTIIEWCNTCGREGKHVRVCEHEDNSSEKCTLAVVSDKVWSCVTCTHRQESPDKTNGGINE